MRKEFSNELNDIQTRYLEANKVMFQRHRGLLNKKSKSETHFKSLLDKAGIKYEREKILQRKDQYFFIDFYIKSMNLCVEIDGKEHAFRKHKDNYKESISFEDDLATTIRYTNEEVLLMKSISVSKLKGRCYKKYVVADEKGAMYGKWSKKNRETKNVLNYQQNQKLHNIEINKNEFQRSKQENDVTIFIESKASYSDSYKPMSVIFKVFEGENLIDSITEEVTEMYSSINKAEVIAATKALEYVYNLGNSVGLKIKLFSRSQFLVGKGSGKYKRHNNDPFCIYNDSIEDFFSVSDVFEDLTYQWLPKEIEAN